MAGIVAKKVEVDVEGINPPHPNAYQLRLQTVCRVVGFFPGSVAVATIRGVALACTSDGQCFAHPPRQQLDALFSTACSRRSFRLWLQSSLYLPLPWGRTG